MTARSIAVRSRTFVLGAFALVIAFAAMQVTPSFAAMQQPFPLQIIFTDPPRQESGSMLVSQSHDHRLVLASKLSMPQSQALVNQCLADTMAKVTRGHASKAALMATTRWTFERCANTFQSQGITR